MDRKANPRLYDEIQDTESLSVVSTFSYSGAIFWLFENVQNSYRLPVAVSFLNNGLVWAVVGRAFLIFFHFWGAGNRDGEQYKGLFLSFLFRYYLYPNKGHKTRKSILPSRFL